MRNFENNFGDQTGGGNTDWESLGDNEFELRSKKRGERRYKEMLESEAMASMRKKVMAWAAAAVLAITVVGGVAAGGLSTPEIMNTERAEEVQTFNVESVTLMNGPYIRSNPWIPDREDGSNIIVDSGQEGQRAEAPYEGEVRYYLNEYDPNGGWYGFPAEEFANVLFENAFISKEEAERIVKDCDSGDGWVWVNENFVLAVEAEPAQN